MSVRDASMYKKCQVVCADRLCVGFQVEEVLRYSFSRQSVRHGNRELQGVGTSSCRGVGAYTRGATICI